MSIATLADLKNHLRELTTDLDDPFQMALDSATAECEHFVGFGIADEFGSAGVPSDIVMACVLLAQVHADMGAPEANEARRAAAQRLLLPYRVDCGFGGA